MWSKLAKISFDELIETLTPEQFKIFFRFTYEMTVDRSSDSDTLTDKINYIYRNALETNNTEMIEIFEDSEFINNYRWEFRDYIIYNDEPNLYYIMSCIKSHLKNQNKNLLYYLSDIINDIEEGSDLDLNLDYIIKYFLMFGCNMNNIVYENIKIDNYFI